VSGIFISDSFRSKLIRVNSPAGRLVVSIAAFPVEHDILTPGFLNPNRSSTFRRLVRPARVSGNVIYLEGEANSNYKIACAETDTRTDTRRK